MLVFFTAILLLCGVRTHGHAGPGKNLLLRGDSAASLGRGGTGVASAGIDFFHLNPASIASLQRFELGLRYGTLDGAFANPGFIAVIPSSYGAFGASYRALSLDDSRDFERAHLLSAGGAKDFTDHLSAGISMNLLYGSNASSRMYNTGLSLGAMYRPRLYWSPGRRWGIFDPAMGFALTSGLSFGDRPNASNFNRLDLGYGLIFYRHALWTLGAYNDVSFLNGYGDYRVKFGIESVLFENYTLRAGGISPGHYGCSGVTAGAGYRVAGEDFEGRIDYSFIYQGRADALHYLGLSSRYGELDRRSPVTGIVPSEKHISPNYDGRRDFVVFKTTVFDKSRIKGWRLQILGPSGEVVREYRLSERDIEDTLSPAAFIRRIWQRKEFITVPESILWDGTDSRGRVVPDGVYSYSFLVWDERDNISTIKTGALSVDTTPPAVEVKTEDILFSPNGDRQKDIFTVLHHVSAGPDDQWTAGFVDSLGAVVKTYHWSGTEVPARLNWDGRDDAGNEPPEGVYSYFIESTDLAGNSVRKIIPVITLTRHYEIADIMASREFFSPPLHTEMRFFLSLSKTTGLEEWAVTIEDRDGRPVKVFSGGAQFEKFVTWDGKDSDGRRLRDGTYHYRLDTRFDSGNIPSSFRKSFVIDGTPPETGLGYSPSLFSPDQDGLDDMLLIRPEAYDAAGIASWNLTIYTSTGIAFKSFQGKGVPAGEIPWDGLNESGELVESAADYYIELEAFDPAGNYAKSGRRRLPIDVLVMVTERGLKIRISNIEFSFNSALLTGKASPVLNRVADILGKYGAYSVLVEGHTDDIGEEEYNLTLSEQRAKSVMDYLIARGIDKERLSFRGMGEIAPFLPNTGEENRRRNRRVEFILIKKAIQ